MESHYDTDCPKAPIACTFSIFGCKERVSDLKQLVFLILKHTVDRTILEKIVFLCRCSATTWLSTCRNSHRCICATWQSSYAALASITPRPNPCGRLDLLFPLKIKELQHLHPPVDQLQTAAATVPHVSLARRCRGSGRWMHDS